MITEEEQQNVLAIIGGFLNQIWEPKIPGDKQVWHYTRGDTAIRILETGVLWATQAAGLNDALEIRYAAKLYRESLQVELKAASDQMAKKFLMRYIDALADTDEVPNHSFSASFVACFTEKADDLNQWRAYGGGENGVALGFQAQDLAGPLRHIGRVVYGLGQQKKLATDLAKATVETYLQMSKTRNQDEAWESEFLVFWDDMIKALAPFVKHPGFEAESEVRIVRPYTQEDLPNLRFMQKRSMISRHLPITLGAQADPKEPKLPLTAVIIGPGRHKHLSLVSMNTLLVQKGYGHVTTNVSSCPLQEV